MNNSTERLSMPANAPYIPTKQALLATWLQNFATLIQASPSTYGLGAGDATNITNANTAWQAAYALVTSPTTKTKTTVGSKNTATVNMLNIIRPYAQQISNNAGVTSANKIALGLNPKTSTPSPITPPASNPVLTILNQNPGIVNLTYRDSATSPTSKAKPYGVKSCQLYGMPSATPITNPESLPQVATMTKSPFQFSFPSGYTKGMTWYFAAVWQIQKGEQSPFSPIITIVAS
jgi:hypothetical protein